MNCINIKSKEFQQLLEETKLPSLMLEMRIAKWQEVNGVEQFPTASEIINSNEVNMSLKTVDILSSDKAVEVFNKGEKNNWTLDKILTELQVPKEQKQIILDKYENNTNNLNQNLNSFFKQFGFQIKDGSSSTDLLRKIIYTDKNNNDVFIDNSIKALSQLILANTNIDFSRLENLIEETKEFKELLANSPEYIKNTHKFLKDGNRIPMEEWVSYIKDYNKIKNTVLEKYLKESLLDKNNSTNLHKLINDFIKWFKTLFGNAKNLKDVTDSLIQQVLNNQREVVINSNDLKNKEKVTLVKALEETTHGKDIIKIFGELGLILTGSVSAAEQGSVFRKTGKLLHDIDWVIPKGFNKNFTKKLKDTFEGSTLVREYDSPSYYTQTYIVPPKGHSISNLTFFNPSVYGKNKYIASYDVLDKSGNIVSNYRRYYDVKPSGKVVENREIYNEGLQNVDKNLEAVSVDFFQNKEDLKYQPYVVKIEDIEIQLANWMSSFTEKLKYGRAKDLLDYANFIPNSNKQSDLREEIITSLLVENSFVIEINTAKTNNIPTNEYGKPNKVNQQAMNLVASRGNSKEAEMYKAEDGWVYLEQDIIIPLITPSITNHATFANKSHSIGHFRAYYNTITKEVHVQEIQSDLFQKGRDRSDLVDIKKLSKFRIKNTAIGYEIVELIEGDNYNLKSRGFVSTKEKAKEIVEKEIKLQELQLSLKNNNNQFLQLLNQKGNWVTIFVKSIIQDSAKKGYEKVLFPTGNTASKIEGHTTLEEFKNQKENRIKELELQSKEFVDKNEFGFNKRFYKSDDGFYGLDTSNNRENVTESEFKHLLKKRLEKNTDEIVQLKQELEKVEKEGFGALKPIYNFYENTVTNILNKTYGKVQDYSNTPIKEGVDDLFEENKELSKIGSKQLYSDYIDTIFPDSKVSEMNNTLYESVLKDLLTSKIIDKKC